MKIPLLCKTIKKAILLTSIIMMLGLNTFTVNGRTVFHSNPQTGEVTVTGQETSLAGKQTTIVAIDKGMISSDGSTSEEAIAYVKQKTADTKGAFVFSFKLPRYGDYLIQISGDGMDQPLTVADQDNAAVTTVVYEDINTSKSKVDFVKGSLRLNNMFASNVQIPITVGSFKLVNDLQGKGVNIIWSSNSPIITITDGVNAVVQRPAAGQPDVSVTLTASITRGAACEQLSIPVTVKAIPLQGRITGASGSPPALGGGGSSNDSPVMPVVTPTSTVYFNDLNGFEWAQESINALAEKGIVVGYGAGVFAPNQPVTREQFITMLTKAFNLVDPGATTTFSDVYGSNNAWYYSPIASAQKLGLTNGQGDGTFGLGQEISRQEMATLAYRMAKIKGIILPDVVAATDFEDQQQIEDYAKEAVGAMQKAGIINGVGDNKFAPWKSSTRAQAAKVIYCLLQLQK